MPFKSEAQRRKFHAMAERGEISKKTVSHWEHVTPKNRKLPMHTKKSAAIAEYVLEKLSWHDSGEVTIERELMGTKPVIEATRQTVEDSLDNEEDSDLEIEKISSIADYVLEKISRKMVREDGKFKSFLKKKKKRQ